MAWNAIIAGELSFPDGLEKWLASQGELPLHDWPQFLASNIDDDADEAVDDPSELTVSARIKNELTLCTTFFMDLDSAKKTAVLRALVGNDDFWAAVNDVVRMLGAAATVGGSGRVFFRLLGTGWGYDDGAILQVANGKISSERIASGRPPSEADQAIIGALMERALRRQAQPRPSGRPAEVRAAAAAAAAKPVEPPPPPKVEAVKPVTHSKPVQSKPAVKSKPVVKAKSKPAAKTKSKSKSKPAKSKRKPKSKPKARSKPKAKSKKR